MSYYSQPLATTSLILLELVQKTTEISFYLHDIFEKHNFYVQILLCYFLNPELLGDKYWIIYITIICKTT